eukprot:TRINITY_DN3866_c0_g2_i1.p1 TRINITY_DN3866_c0_g2~~TRINITY_DN3866_c0_g2_i1.p1  ORF type:complete len:247 (+),score=29.67 TRINITY_DN3866_c0_g2_i1:331-1071(+)
MFGKNQSFAQDNPYTRVEVTVNNVVKGMYYCLIESGTLLLNKNLDREQAEYEIPLEKYAFRAESKFKIKFVHNQLVIKLTFSCQTERENWLEYFFKAQQSIYSYASLPPATKDHTTVQHTKLSETSSMTLPSNKTYLEILSSKTSYPTFKRCWSVEDGLDRISSRPEEDIVDLSGLNLQIARKEYENSITLFKNKITSSSPAKNRSSQLFNRFINPRNVRKVDDYENVSKNSKLITKKKKLFHFDI